MVDAQKPEPVAVEQGDHDLLSAVYRLARMQFGASPCPHDEALQLVARHRLAERARLTTDRSLGAEDFGFRNDIRRSIIRQLGDDPHADRIILRPTDWDIVLEALAATPPVPAISEASNAVTPALHEGGRFADWQTVDLAAQCLSQAREQLDPEFSQFMTAVAQRLSVPAISGEGEKLRETWASIAAWCEETFGPVTLARTAERANEEMQELLAEPENVIEAADVCIVLSRYPGLWDAVERKMAINRARKWDVRGDGTGYHIPAAALATPDAAPIGSDDAGANDTDSGTVEIPAGMVPWHGGERAPDDWAGPKSRTLLRNGLVVWGGYRWTHCNDETPSGTGATDIIAYTPKPAALSPASSLSGEG